MKSRSDLVALQKFFAFSICFLAFAKASAQVKVTLIQISSKEPVTFATVEAKYKKNPPKYSISDSTGVFLIDTIDLQSIHISHSGFFPLMRTVDGSNALNSIFEMTPVSNTLATVEVRSVRPLVQSDASRISYDVARDSTFKDKTAAEAIARLPFMSIDAMNNISYKNGRSFAVFVNGARFGMLTQDPKAALKSIPASTIESVELIFDPPLEYKLRGYDAVINIITRAGYYKGVVGSAGGSVTSTWDWESEPYLSFQHNQTYVQLTYHLRGYNQNKSFTSAFNGSSSGTSTQQTNNFNSKFSAPRIGLSLDQRLGSRSRFGMFLTLSESDYQGKGQSIITTSKPDTIQTQTSNALLESRKNYFDAGFDFIKNYGSKRSNFSMLFKYSQEVSRSFSTSSLTPFYRDRLRQTPAEFLLQLGNSLDVKKNLSLETVLRLTRRRAGSMSASDTLLRDGWAAADPERNNVFQFTVSTLTNTVSYRTKKISTRLGLGVDYANYLISGEAAPYSRNALNLLPMASVRWVVGKNQYLSLTHRARLYRPTFQSLASAVPNYDPLVVTIGNPQLSTQVEHRFAPEYSFYFGKDGSSSAYVTTEFDFSNSYFNTYSMFDQITNKRIISYRQSKYRRLYFIAGGDFEYSPKWSSTGSVSVGFTKLGDNTSNEPIYWLNHSIIYRMSSVSGVQFSANYNSRFVTSMGYLTGYGTYDLNIYRFFLQRRLQMNLSINNFLRKDRVQTERVYGEGFEIRNTERQPFRAIQLTAYLRFGRLKTFEMNAKKISANDVIEIK